MDNSKTTVEKVSDCEVVVKHTVNAPAHLVYEAWTNVDLFRRWWVPKSFGLNLVSCELDVRVGGQYRLEFLHEGSTMEFFGTYVEVDPPSRLVWTNEEDGGMTVTTVTFTETDGQTQIMVHDRYPTPESVEFGSTGAMPETFAQLDELLAGME